MLWTPSGAGSSNLLRRTFRVSEVRHERPGPPRPGTDDAHAARRRGGRCADCCAGPQTRLPTAPSTPLRRCRRGTIAIGTKRSGGGGGEGRGGERVEGGGGERGGGGPQRTVRGRGRGGR